MPLVQDPDIISETIPNSQVYVALNWNYNHCRTLMICSQDFKSKLSRFFQNIIIWEMHASWQCFVKTSYHAKPLSLSFILSLFSPCIPPPLATGTIAGLWFDAVVSCRLQHWLLLCFWLLLYAGWGTELNAARHIQLQSPQPINPSLPLTSLSRGWGLRYTDREYTEGNCGSYQ